MFFPSSSPPKGPLGAWQEGTRKGHPVRGVPLSFLLYALPYNPPCPRSPPHPCGNFSQVPYLCINRESKPYIRK